MTKRCEGQKPSMFPMRILSDPSGSVEILAFGIELGDLALMDFESFEIVSILEQAELGVERFRHLQRLRFLQNAETTKRQDRRKPARTLFGFVATCKGLQKHEHLLHHQLSKRQ